MSSSVRVDNKGKDILIIGEGPTEWLGDTTLIAEAKYPVNFTQSRKTFVLSLHNNGSNIRNLRFNLLLLICILMNTVKNFTTIHSLSN